MWGSLGWKQLAALGFQGQGQHCQLRVPQRLRMLPEPILLSASSFTPYSKHTHSLLLPGSIREGGSGERRGLSPGSH